MTASSTVQQAAGALQPAKATGWRRGFANILEHENHVRWANHAWLVQGVIWLAIVNGVVAIVTVAARQDPNAPPEGIYGQLVQLFFVLGMMATGIGVIIATQSAIVGEKQLGTAAWVLSKPVSRPAFILTKLLATAVAFLVLAIAVPALVFYGESLWAVGRAPTPGLYVAGLALFALHTLFYLALTLMLGTLFEERGAVLGIGLAVLLGGIFVPSFLPQAAVPFPWMLGTIATALALGQPLPPLALVSVALCVVWVILFVAVAIRRFSRTEF